MFRPTRSGPCGRCCVIFRDPTARPPRPQSHETGAKPARGRRAGRERQLRSARSALWSPIGVDRHRRRPRPQPLGQWPDASAIRRDGRPRRSGWVGVGGGRCGGDPRDAGALGRRADSEQRCFVVGESLWRLGSSPRRLAAGSPARRPPGSRPRGCHSRGRRRVYSAGNRMRSRARGLGWTLRDGATTVRWRGVEGVYAVVHVESGSATSSRRHPVASFAS